MTPLLVLAAVVAQPPTGHADRNPLFRELTADGLAVGPDLRAKLPAPAMADGLDPAGQRAVISKLVGNEYTLDEFTRKSAVAPFLLRLTADVTPSDPAAPARAVDAYFVAHGDFAAADDEKFLDRLLNSGRGRDDRGHGLTADQLARRKIVPAPGESFGRLDFDFLDRVRLSVTGRAVWTKTADSVLAAAAVDPRFRDDPELPNRWRPLSKSGGGLTAGDPQPYGGAGLYLKITRLADPAGALFVEQHVVFTEPTGWFNGANLLRSKLPPVMQDRVRTMRREWAKR